MKTFRASQLVVTLTLVFTFLAACGSSATTPDPNAPKPSKPGGTGKALTLTGNIESGKQLFSGTCAQCHGDEGKHGLDNPGSTDGTIPVLNPIDPKLANSDPKVFAANIDLFIEHGSKPEGPNPKSEMPAIGDNNQMDSQQIADVIAYVISLNQK